METPESSVRPEVMTFDDIAEKVPALKSHPRLVNALFRLLRIDEVNRVHGRWCATPGPQFVKDMVEKDFKITVDVEHPEILENLPEGPFITVSNHPFGSIDGILLIYLITRYRPKFKVMVNMTLNMIQAMRPNFIAVDALASDDPEKKKVSVRGIREAIRQLRSGEPLGFFPAGAMSKVDRHWKLKDREWQPSVIELISHAGVPVIPVFFQGGNSFWFNLMGRVCWPIRSVMLPREVFKKRGKRMTVTFGTPISPEEIKSHASSVAELAEWLRNKTFELQK